MSSLIMLTPPNECMVANVALRSHDIIDNIVSSPSDIIECVNAVTRSTARVQDESNQTEAIQMLSPVSLPTNTMKETFVTAQKG